MLDVFEKIMIGLFIVCIIVWFVGYGVLFYKAATGDTSVFARRVYIVNQDFCKEATK
jgi:hypothetical protein